MRGGGLGTRQGGCRISAQARKLHVMRFTSKASCAIGIVAAIVLATSAADARSRHIIHYRDAPYAYDGAYDADPGSFERAVGSSVPYDADGPAYNDFQLQGR